MDENKHMNIADEYLKKLSEVNYLTRLPETEFEVMKAVWDAEPPVTTSLLMNMIGKDRGWKTPTLISFLVRLEDRGFIMSFKNGKERNYIPLADREIYIKNVTEDFIDKYHDGSFVNLLDSLYYEKDFSDDEIDALLDWIRKKFGDIEDDGNQ